MSSSLQQLDILSIIAADTADFNVIKSYSPSEATTNPSIILQAATQLQYKEILQKSIEYGLNSSKLLEDMLENAMDMVNVLFGEEILKYVTSKVHVQIDPRLAFNTERSISRAIKLINLFKDRGVSSENVVIKLPATWEGIEAARILENNHDIRCNMTTMFNLVQAATCAEAGVTYLAPFVGRIQMWYESKTTNNLTDKHEGVKALKLIQRYMNKFGYKTKVMGAYFVNADEVTKVAGCDAVTLPVPLMSELSTCFDTVSHQMREQIENLPSDKIVLSEAKFRWLMNEDEMATDLLSEVIRNFTADYNKLEGIVKSGLLKLYNLVY